MFFGQIYLNFYFIYRTIKLKKSIASFEHQQVVTKVLKQINNQTKFVKHLLANNRLNPTPTVRLIVVIIQMKNSIKKLEMDLQRVEEELRKENIAFKLKCQEVEK